MYGDMRDMRYDIILIGVIVLGIGGYYFYRDTQSNKLSRMESFATARTVPSTICTLNVVDFEGASAGVLYVHSGRIALDMTRAGGGWRGSFRVLIEPDGAHYVDPDSADALPAGLSPDDQVSWMDALIFAHTWDCSPWWIPDNSMFIGTKLIVELE